MGARGGNLANSLPPLRATQREILERAKASSEEKLRKSQEYFKAELPNNSIDPAKVCFGVPGSIGRREGLEASDFDLLAVVADESTLNGVRAAWDNLRTGLRAALGGIDVSTGRSVMGVVSLSDLADNAKIGGDGDDRIALTRRVVVLTEAAAAGGGLVLREARRTILEAYTARNSDRHPLGFCNDVARYYRQLCMDYKRKHADEAADWAENNTKLRHSRKFWYFSTVLTIASVTEERGFEAGPLTEALLDAFELPPVARLVKAAGSQNGVLCELLEQYAWYLQYLSDPGRREELNEVPHESRYEKGPYAALQWSSRVLHSLMLQLLEQGSPGVRRRVLDWFLL
jgi:hypothetical protein